MAEPTISEIVAVMDTMTNTMAEIVKRVERQAEALNVYADLLGGILGHIRQIIGLFEVLVGTSSKSEAGPKPTDAKPAEAKPEALLNKLTGLADDLEKRLKDLPKEE